MQNTINAILFPTDFSDAANAALGYAVDLAKKHSATLHIVCVVDPQIYAYAGYVSLLSPDDLLAGPKKSMEELELPADAASLTVKREVIEGYVDEALSDYAKHNNVDLIVMSSHTRSKVSRFFLGSVADRVMRSSPCPLLMLRGPAEGKTLPTVSLDQVTNILVPCDFSQASEEAISRGGALARDFGATMHVVHALDLGSLSLLGQDFDNIAIEEATKRANEHLNKLVKQYAGEAKVIAHVAEGDPSDVLSDYVANNHINMIVVGNIRRGEFGKLILGSVTNTLARETHLPIWIEPADEVEAKQ